jgi:hypothetical protein
MAITDSALDSAALGRARALLKKPQNRGGLWPVLGAALLLATSALAFAAVVILGPPSVSRPVAAATASLDESPALLGRAP